ncbi:DUF1656 domain-containing protein [Zavarzinia compransoris]|uniref:DUF1656 domain-containing protein n=1 Tax=Zavarzinia marina TaxID=2911065 RepID=UPI001F3E8874|nr:DUF1656 domain-containing protein [Zavarzinia marina]MCF4165651.1 DUF1656 domain-containing protein [Zavarzinia marina]
MLMLKEIDLFGVFLAPMMLYVVIAGALWLGLRRLLSRFGVYRAVWHPPLFNAALFLILLAGIAAAGYR